MGSASPCTVTLRATVSTASARWTSSPSASTLSFHSWAERGWPGCTRVFTKSFNAIVLFPFAAASGRGAGRRPELRSGLDPGDGVTGSRFAEDALAKDPVLLLEFHAHLDPRRLETAQGRGDGGEHRVGVGVEVAEALGDQDANGVGLVLHPGELDLGCRRRARCRRRREGRALERRRRGPRQLLHGTRRREVRLAEEEGEAGLAHLDARQVGLADRPGILVVAGERRGRRGGGGRGGGGAGRGGPTGAGEDE